MYLLFLLSCTCNAAQFYFSQDGAGTQSGSTAGDSKPISQFNLPSNWSGTPGTTGKISPGDTIRLVGTITTALKFNGSGTASQPIILLFENGAKLSAPTWATAAISIEGDNYAGLKRNIVIDGGTNGIIESTESGTNGRYKTNGYGIRAVGVSDFTVRNLTLRNLFVRTPGPDTSTPGIAISWIPAVNAAQSGLRVTNCTIDHAFIGVSVGYNTNGVSSVEIDNNVITHTNWGIQVGSYSTGSTIRNVNIHHNRVSQWSNWDEPQTNFHHHNGIFVWTGNSDTTATCTGLSIHGNHIGPDYGRYATSGIYISAPGHRDPNGPLIYNNLFETDSSAPSNGDIFVVPGAGAGTRIYNNTHIGGSGIAIGYGGDHGGQQTVHIKNNLVAGVGKTALNVSYGSNVTAYINRNLYSRLQTSPSGFSWSTNSTGSFKSLSQWQALGFDLNSYIPLDPLLDGNYAPTATSVAVGNGEDLSGSFAVDRAGGQRSVPWTIGAHNMIGGVVPAAPSDPSIKNP